MVRDTQRGPQSYMEKRRGRREIEVTRRRRGEVKRRETNLTSNQFPKCSPQPGTPKETHRLRQRREEGPPFKENGLPFWVSGVLCQHSEVVSWNLYSIQMIFWWICGEESGLPILFLCHLWTAPAPSFFIELGTLYTRGGSVSLLVCTSTPSNMQCPGACLYWTVTGQAFKYWTTEWGPENSLEFPPGFFPPSFYKIPVVSCKMHY